MAARDANNAEWQRDLIVSLVKVRGARAYLIRVLNIAVSLKEAGKLAPGYDSMVDDLKKAIAQ